MGWKAIKSLNKQEHLDKEAASAAPQVTEEKVVVKNALQELPLSETHEVITGPGGWMVAVPLPEETEVKSEPVIEESVTVLPVVEEEVVVAVVEETPAIMPEVEKPAKKPSGKKKKVAEPT